jgi:hypothetical protein
MIIQAASAGSPLCDDHSDTRPKIIDDSVMRFGAR